MLSIVLIIIGVILIVAGIIGLISVYIQPIKKAIRVFYGQDLDDFWYEHGRGQLVQQEGKRILLTLYTLLIVLGLCALIPGLVMRYMPKGNAPVVSDAEIGADAFNDHNAGVSNPAVRGDYYVVISGDVVSMNGKEYASLEAFENDLKVMDRTGKVSVTDDFAVSATYHKVIELINRYGLVYGDGSE